MKAALARFEQVLKEQSQQLRQISEETALQRPEPAAWSAKEVLGHLLDSASNNHQRFIRGQLGHKLHSSPYDQERWVELGAYQSRAWSELVDFWLAYNHHLLHVARNIRPEFYGTEIVIGASEPVTLEFVVIDYVRHLEHHLRQLYAAIAPAAAAPPAS